LASTDRYSRTLLGVFAGNLFLRATVIAIGFTQTFPEAGG
jgi:hypothetical protein